jgi:hypothetical protein
MPQQCSQAKPGHTAPGRHISFFPRSSTHSFHIPSEYVFGQASGVCTLGEILFSDKFICVLSSTDPPPLTQNISRFSAPGGLGQIYSLFSWATPQGLQGIAEGLGA